MPVKENKEPKSIGYPWDIDRSASSKDQDLIDWWKLPLWQAMRPKDFIFGMHFNIKTDITLVFIVPLEYFEQHQIMYQDSMPIGKMLPEYLIEFAEGAYETNKKFFNVKEDMLKIGFIENREFQKYLNAYENM